jgi:hypothetical protein
MASSSPGRDKTSRPAERSDPQMPRMLAKLATRLNTSGAAEPSHAGT